MKNWLSKYKNGGDISIPNVYPNQMIPKFDPGGSLDCPCPDQPDCICPETTYTHQPAGKEYNGKLGESYMLKRTQTPYTKYRDIRKYTQVPTDPRQVNFLSNYAGAIGEPLMEGYGPYPTEVPFEGAKHWNIDRFIIDPQFSNKLGNLRADESTLEQNRNNVLSDMYKYYMLQDPEHKGKAFRKAKRFVRQEVDPRIKGEFLKAYNEEDLGTITGFTDQNHLKDLYWNQAIGEGTVTSDDVEKLKKVSMDYFKNYRKMSKKDAEALWKKWEEDAEAINYKQKYGGWLDKYSNIPKFEKGGEPCPDGQVRVNGQCMPMAEAEALRQRAYQKGLDFQEDPNNPGDFVTVGQMPSITVQSRPRHTYSDKSINIGNGVGFNYLADETGKPATNIWDFTIPAGKGQLAAQRQKWKTYLPGVFDQPLYKPLPFRTNLNGVSVPVEEQPQFKSADPKPQFLTPEQKERLKYLEAYYGKPKNQMSDWDLSLKAYDQHTDYMARTGQFDDIRQEIFNNTIGNPNSAYNQYGKIISNFVLPAGVLAGGALAAPIVGPAVTSALSAPLTVGSTTVPWLTGGNMLGLYGGYQAANQLTDPNSMTRQAISQAYNNPTALNIANAGALGGLDLLGVATVPGMGGLMRNTAALPNYLKNTYNTVATGESFLPVAWKSPAVGLSEEASQNMFRKVFNNANLTDAERAVVADYQYNSRLYTGRSGEVDPVKRQAINDIIKKYNISVGNDAIATRMFNPENNSLGAILDKGRLNFGDRPTSFTVGAKGRWGSGATDRLVIPNRYLKGMGDKFVKNTYEPLSENALKLVPEGSRNWAAGIGVDNAMLGQERELIGTGLDFRRIGKVKNDVGGYDWIVKPKSNKSFQLPSFNNRSGISGKLGMSSSDDPFVKEFLSFSPQEIEAIRTSGSNIDDFIANRVKQLNTPEGQRRLQMFIDNNKGLVLPGTTPADLVKKVETVGNLNKTYFDDINTYLPDVMERMKNLKADLKAGKISNTDYESAINQLHDEKSFIEQSIKNFEEGYGSSGYISGDGVFISPKYNPADVSSVTEHEVIGHGLQDGTTKTNFDKELEALELLDQPYNMPSAKLDLNVPVDQRSTLFNVVSKNPEGVDYFPNVKNYFVSGSRELEKFPQALELRQQLLKEGKIKDLYDDIPEQMLVDQYTNYMNLPQGVKYPLRIYDIMKNSPGNFKILSDVLNRAPAVIPVVGGAAAVGAAATTEDNSETSQQKYGGWINKYKHTNLNKFLEGGESGPCKPDEYWDTILKKCVKRPAAFITSNLDEYDRRMQLASDSTNAALASRLDIETNDKRNAAGVTETSHNQSPVLLTTDKSYKEKKDVVKRVTKYKKGPTKRYTTKEYKEKLVKEGNDPKAIDEFVDQSASVISGNQIINPVAITTYPTTGADYDEKGNVIGPIGELYIPEFQEAKQEVKLGPPKYSITYTTPDGKQHTFPYIQDYETWKQMKDRFAGSRAFVSSQEKGDKSEASFLLSGLTEEAFNRLLNEEYVEGNTKPIDNLFNSQPSSSEASLKYQQANKKFGGGIPKYKIDLNLPKYEPRKGFFTGYNFSQNIAPDVNMYGVGAHGERKVSDRLTLTGDINSSSVFYPGGSQLFMNPNMNVGVKYRFKKGGNTNWLSKYK